jgi:hypothetical protein
LDQEDPGKFFTADKQSLEAVSGSGSQKVQERGVFFSK